MKESDFYAEELDREFSSDLRDLILKLKNKYEKTTEEDEIIQVICNNLQYEAYAFIASSCINKDGTIDEDERKQFVDGALKYIKISSKQCASKIVEIKKRIKEITKH